MIISQLKEKHKEKYQELQNEIEAIKEENRNYQIEWEK